MTDPLATLRAAARKAAAAHLTLRTEILLARANGHSLRAIAEAAGISYETVRRICSE